MSKSISALFGAGTITGKSAAGVAVALSLFSLPALAGGSIGLAELMPLLAQRPTVLGEVSGVLNATGSSVTEITCEATRLGVAFGPLQGERVGPFVCPFKDQSQLILETTNKVMLENGTLADLDPALVGGQKSAYLTQIVEKSFWRMPQP